MFFDIFLFLVLIAIVFFLCNVGCEYRNYSSGHKFIKAFKAKGCYQKLFTMLQMEKDIDSRDLGKITYIGFIVVLISSISAVFIIPYTIFSYLSISRNDAIHIFMLWSQICGGLAIVAMIIQGFDSILNRLFDFINRRL